MRRDAFRPSRDGFAFPNVFDEPGTSFGLGLLLPGFGLGAGMVWAALDRYLAGRTPPELQRPPVPADPLHAELVRRQANALAVATWQGLIEWQTMPARGFPDRPGLAELSRAQWQRARRSLDAGVPVLLFLVLASGRHANPSANRAVLAVGYELDRRAGRVSLLVYDPGRPGNDNVRLTFRTDRAARLDARLAVDTEVRGFFTVPYDRPIPAMMIVHPPVVMGGPPVDAVVALLADGRTGGPLDVLARGRDGELLHLRRDRRGRWSAHGVNASPGRAAAAVKGVAPLGRRSFLARAGNGDLLEFRRLPVLGWRARNGTGARPNADDFRIDGDPVVLRRWYGREVVFACRRGKLVRYRRGALHGWNADRPIADSLAKANLAGSPAVAELEHEVHVLCRTGEGDLLHVRRRGKAGWVPENVTLRAGRARFAIADDPIVLQDDAGRCLNVVARSSAGDVLLFRWTGRGGWRGIELSAVARAAGHALPAVQSRLSAALDPEGTVHVVARDADGGLVHIWRARTDGTGGEEITRARRGIGERGTIDGAPVIAPGPAGMLHVFARQRTELLLFRWTAVADWTVENVSREHHARAGCSIAGDPVLVRAGGAAHLVFADAAGRVQHACAALPSERGRGRVRRAVADRLADLAAALFRPVRVLGFAVTRAARMTARAKRSPRPALPRSLPAQGSPGGGMGARFVRRTPPLFAPPPTPVPAPPPVAEPESRPAAARRPAAATRPALEGLPLLDAPAGEQPETKAPPAPALATAGASAAPRPQGATGRDRVELRRIMALAEESAPRVL